ncbi:MAG TPA: hypothetical protein VGE51_16750 [Fontimonas sp.]
MKFQPSALALAMLSALLVTSAWATSNHSRDTQPTTLIDIAGHQVPVVAGGLYDRFRSNPPLSVVERESPGTDLSWFKSLEKTKVDIGFESYSPNFYYENSRVSVIFTADLDRLRDLIPPDVLAQVQPLSIWPGRGLVALTAYAYHYCDNDSYNEIALAIVTTRPGQSNLGPISLIGQAMSKDFWGYVIDLPVDTELARVRGVVGYNLPKWLTRIDYRQTDSAVIFEIDDPETGAVDVTLETARLSELSDDKSLVTNSFVNLDHAGQLSYGYAVSRPLQQASSTDGGTVSLRLSDGPMSTLIKSLKLGRMLRYEYIPSFQSALYAPRPLSERQSKP